MSQEPELSVSEQQAVRIEHLHTLQEQGFDPYTITKVANISSAADIKGRYADLANEEESSDTVRAAGRISAWRGHGKR